MIAVGEQPIKGLVSPAAQARMTVGILVSWRDYSLANC